MNPGDSSNAITNTVTQKVVELHQLLDRVCFLLDQNLPNLVVNPAVSREKVLKEAIKEAIDELEESRKSFKSRRLELLRKRLTQVLLDVNGIPQRIPTGFQPEAAGRKASFVK